MKIEIFNDAAGRPSQWVFFCPGCKYDHGYDSRWEFNGDFEKPTFTPSLLVNSHEPKSLCHLYVTDGKIQFLADCHHELAGQTVDMLEVEK